MAEESRLTSIWGQRELGVDITEKAVFRSFTHSDIVYVTNYSYPFIQVVNGSETAQGSSNPMDLRFLTASTGWIIHDYGDAISTSAPHSKRSVKESEDDQGEGGGGGGGAGIGQQAETMAELAALIQQKGWASVELIAGSKLMQRFLWIETEKLGIKLNKFEPNQDDTRCRDRLKKRPAVKVEVPHVVPMPGLAND